jgi:hypothetical protein
VDKHFLAGEVYPAQSPQQPLPAKLLARGRESRKRSPLPPLGSRPWRGSSFRSGLPLDGMSCENGLTSAGRVPHPPHQSQEVPPSQAVFRRVHSCSAVFSRAQPCSAVLSRVQSAMLICVQPCSAIISQVQPSSFMSICVQPCSAAFSRVQPCSAVLSRAQPGSFVFMFICVQPCSFSRTWLNKK